MITSLTCLSRLMIFFIFFKAALSGAVFLYTIYFLWSFFVFSSDTSAYIIVVVIFTCPNNFCTSSTRIPLNNPSVAVVCLIRCGYTLLPIPDISPSWRTRFSIVAFLVRSWTVWLVVLKFSSVFCLHEYHDIFYFFEIFRRNFNLLLRKESTHISVH